MVSTSGQRSSSSASNRKGPSHAAQGAPDKRWARPDAATAAPSRSESDESPKGSIGSRLFTVLIAVVLMAVIAALVVALLVQQGVFNITAIDATASQHLTGEEIAKLADVKSGTSLISIDRGAIEASVKKNPWVKSVTITREFPSTLGISIEERQAKAVVLMNSGDKAWLLGEDNYWIEPVALDASMGRTARDLAYERAMQLGCLFIENVPATMVPEAGYAATDDVLLDVDIYLEEFSDAFKSQIVSFSVASQSAIGCTLKNGVEISLGAPEDIAQKEAVALKILEEHQNDVTFINVRIPSKATYRKAGVPQSNVDPSAYSSDTSGSQGSGGLLSDAYSVDNAGSNAVPSSGSGTSIDGAQGQTEETYTEENHEYDYGYGESYDESYDYGYEEQY